MKKSWGPINTSVNKNILIMPTNKAIRETFRKGPEFSERVQAILQLHNSPMSINKLEN